MINIDETIQWFKGEFADLLSDDFLNPWDLRTYEAVMTVLSTLDYAQLLTDKFGSLEQALEAEKVTHCWECGIWNPDKQICNKPCESMKWRGFEDYCCDGKYYRMKDEKFRERLLDIADLFKRECIPLPEKMKAALERSREDIE